MYVLKINIYGKPGCLFVFVALETLLSVEAIDKLDPLNRITSKTGTKAQGVANLPVDCWEVCP